jgi:predicted regulator of Ras-like GTPase activity (Roadblock/LC7/MglB family)
MNGSDLVVYEEEFKRIDAELNNLHRQANAKVVFLASLTAGNIAATGSIAKILGEKEFTILFHEGERDNLHISLVGDRIILVVIFDQRTSIGLVRLRVKKTTEHLVRIFDEMTRKAEQERMQSKLEDSPFAEISDEDIEKLFM